MDRSNVLFTIEKALKQRGVKVQIRSVADFREVFPSCPRSIELEAVARDIPTMKLGTLKRWQRRRSVGAVGKLRLSVEEIRSLRLEGIPVATIARSAGVTRSRIYQILKENKND